MSFSILKISMLKNFHEMFGLSRCGNMQVIRQMA